MHWKLRSTSSDFWLEFNDFKMRWFRIIYYFILFYPFSITYFTPFPTHISLHWIDIHVKLGRKWEEMEDFTVKIVFPPFFLTWRIPSLSRVYSLSFQPFLISPSHKNMRDCIQIKESRVNIQHVFIISKLFLGINLKRRNSNK